MYSEVRNVHMELRLSGDGGKRVEMKMWDVRVEDTDTEVMESGIQRWTFFWNFICLRLTFSIQWF